jgi:hypothetical protein
LIIADRRYELGHLGPDFALLGTAQDIAAEEGVIELNVDGQINASRVRFTSPITQQSRRFSFEAFAKVE